MADPPSIPPYSAMPCYVLPLSDIFSHFYYFPHIPPHSLTIWKILALCLFVCLFFLLVLDFTYFAYFADFVYFAYFADFVLQILYILPILPILNILLIFAYFAYFAYFADFAYLPILHIFAYLPILPAYFTCLFSKLYAWLRRANNRRHKQKKERICCQPTRYRPHSN